ncbi:MAG: endonuclease/exonuclease/phosphatase family protein [Thermomicrobiales bacterium]
MRVMTYNIRHGLGHPLPGKKIGEVDLERIATVILEHDSDVVAIQEVDRFWSRSGFTDQVEALARRLDMFPAFASNLCLEAESVERNPRQYGVLTLSRQEPTAINHVLFPPAQPFEQRGFLEVHVPDPVLGTIRVFNTHLEVGRPNVIAESTRVRNEQARLLSDLVSSSEIPAVVMGDFNGSSGDPELDPLLMNKNGLQDAWMTSHPDQPGFTIPADPVSSADRRIDFILATKELSVRNCSVPVTSTTRLASDHFPVIADLDPARYPLNGLRARGSTSGIVERNQRWRIANLE